jgi:hypothetical protein
MKRTLMMIMMVIDSGLVGRKVFFNHHICPVVSGAQTHRTHNRPQDLWEVLTRREDEEPTQSQISTSILKYTTENIARLGGRPGGIHARPFEPSIKSQFWEILTTFGDKYHKMAPRTNQRLQERTWDTPTKGLLWV